MLFSVAFFSFVTDYQGNKKQHQKRTIMHKKTKLFMKVRSIKNKNSVFKEKSTQILVCILYARKFDLHLLKAS